MESVIFGNVTIDANTVRGKTSISPGGSSFFIGSLLSNMDVKSKVISPYGRDFLEYKNKDQEYIPDFPLYSQTLRFENIYGKGGTRTQKVSKKDSASFSGINFIESLSEKNDIVIVAPILNNINGDLLSEVTDKSKNSLKVLLPQGFFRKIENGKVLQCTCRISPEIINMFDLVVASEKDHSLIDTLAGEWGSGSGIAVITRGGNPATVYTKGIKKDYPAFNLSVIKDETGAGDIFAGAFSYAYFKSHDLDKSVYFAHAAGALSLRFRATDIKYGYKDIVEFGKSQNKDLNI